MASTKNFNRVFRLKQNSRKEYIFTLMAGNGEPLGQSEGYEKEIGRENGIAAICSRVILYSLNHPKLSFFNRVWSRVFKYMPKKEIIKALDMVVPEGTINKYGKTK